jgi:DNA processing protein
MSSLRNRLIHLHSCQSVSWSNTYQILKIDPTLKSLYQLSPSQLHEKFQLPLNKMEILFKSLHSTSLNSMLEQYKCQNIQCITLLDPTYPFSLKQIYDPPWVLYVKGQIDILLNKRLIAIVGTRTPTLYGVKTTQSLVQSIVNDNWVTVSGLAKGIDTIVHQTTICNQGKTISVLGSGILNIYPSENNLLSKKIGKEHLLVSEYPPACPPKRWHFPARNRIISGLSLGAVVVEAREKSGSLITADLALQQNREVFAVPGPVTSSLSVGTNLLIQKGAKLVQSPQDIFSEFEHVIE